MYGRNQTNAVKHSILQLKIIFFKGKNNRDSIESGCKQVYQIGLEKWQGKW